jgi:hypothetical protein
MEEHDSVKEAAFKVWSKENENFIDRYGYAAFKIIGLTGIATSVAATFWGGFHLYSAYIVIFFLSLIFFIGGVAWSYKESPNKKDIESINKYERKRAYGTDYEDEQDVATTVRARAHAAKEHRTRVNVGDWSERSYTIGKR